MDDQREAHRARQPFESCRAWDRAAVAWDKFVQSGADYYRHEVHGPALLEACGDVTGQKALDLGCGQGYFTRALASAGAYVTGTDISEHMIRLAVEHERRNPRGARYETVDAAALTERWANPQFDLVTACMALQDMGDTRGVLRGVKNVLVSSGRLVLSVPHPLTETSYREWERDAAGRKVALRIDRYFDTGEARFDWIMERPSPSWSTPYWRYTLSEWSGLFREAGFLIRSLYEPRPDAAAVERNPDLDDCGRVPYFLIFDLVTSEIA